MATPPAAVENSMPLPESAPVSEDDAEDLFDAPPLEEEPHPVPEPEPVAVADPVPAEVEEPPMVEQPKPAPVPGATVVTTHQIKYPAGFGPKIPGMPGTTQPQVPGVPRHQQDAAKYFDEIADDPNCSGYRLQVRRTKPNTWDGYRIFRVDALEDLQPPIRIEHLRQMIAETHGGGVFQVKAITPSGHVARQLEFTIDTAAYPPHVPEGSPFVGGAAASNRMLGPGTSLFGGAEGVGGSLRTVPGMEIQAINQAKQVLEGTIQLKRIEKAARDQEREFKREEEREREREEMKAMQPTLQAQQQVDALRSEMRTMFDGLKEVVRTVADSKKDDKSVDVLLKKMETDAQMNIKSMEMQSQQMTTMFTALASAMKREDPKPPIDMATLLQVLSSSNEKMLQMAMTGSSKADRLVEAIITNKMTQPENQLKTAMDFMERGKRDTMEMMELLQGQGEPSEVINPEGGFWGNLGNVFVHGLSRLVNGAASGGSGKIAEALAGLAAKPVQGSVFNPTFEPAALPGPVQTPQLPAPAVAPAQTVAQAPVARTPVPASPFYDTVMDDEQTYGEPRPASTPRTATAPVAPSVAAPVQLAPGADDDLREHVTEAMEQAVRDLDAGRRDPDWPDYALGKWNNSFLQQLAQAPDDSARIRLIGTQCDPQVFEQIVMRLRANTGHVVNFTAGLHVLIQEFLRGDDVRQPAA